MQGQHRHRSGVGIAAMRLVVEQDLRGVGTVCAVIFNGACALEATVVSFHMALAPWVLAVLLVPPAWSAWVLELVQASAALLLVEPAVAALAGAALQNLLGIVTVTAVTGTVIEIGIETGIVTVIVTVIEMIEIETLTEMTANVTGSVLRVDGGTVRRVGNVTEVEATGEAGVTGVEAISEAKGVVTVPVAREQRIKHPHANVHDHPLIMRLHRHMGEIAVLAHMMMYHR